jgi:hypothetical protein
MMVPGSVREDGQHDNALMLVSLGEVFFVNAPVSKRALHRRVADKRQFGNAGELEAAGRVTVNGGNNVGYAFKRKIVLTRTGAPSEAGGNSIFTRPFVAFSTSAAQGRIPSTS